MSPFEIRIKLFKMKTLSFGFFTVTVRPLHHQKPKLKIEFSIAQIVLYTEKIAYSVS